MSDFTPPPAPAPMPAAPAEAPSTGTTPDGQPLVGGHTADELGRIAEYLGAGSSPDSDIARTADELNVMLGREPTQPVEGPIPASSDDVYLDAEGRARDRRTNRYVPHQALHAERLRRKEVETKAHEAEVRAAKAEERLATLSELVNAARQADPYAFPDQQPPHDPNAEIDPEVDLFGAVKQLKQQLTQAKKTQENQLFQDSLRSDITDFVRQTPDFFDAYRHLAAARDAELVTLGVSDPQARREHLLREEQALAVQALRTGKSPAKIFYNLAKGRGYGRAAVPQYQQPAPQAVQQIQHLQHGVANSATLSGMGGTTGGGLSLEALVNLPDDQFAEIVTKLGGPNSPKFKRAFGG
jgi:hypothetical protein